MLEDCVMEKKNSRSVLPLGKGNGTDSKKSQDGGVGKGFSRSARRRENPGPPAPSKYDPIRKQNPQKSKAFDKRPRPRGPYMASGTESSQVGATEAEYGSVFSPGSKKHNLNHLLNFHYAPRQTTQSHQWRSGGASGSARFLLGTHPHKYNKEQFLQANCQFVVKAGADYRQYLCNPDQLVEWDHIEQIRVISAEVPSCPICLYPPKAAKMTRCGHVFCWSCILHYLELSDTAWRKCPICYESVHKKDLKSVMSMATKSYDVGDLIEMRLMRREKGSLQVIPVEQYQQWPKGSLLSVSEKVDTAYAKLLEADSYQVMEVLKRERSELEAQLEDVKDTEEVCFVESALTLLTDREAALQVLDLKKAVAGKTGEVCSSPDREVGCPPAAEPCFEGDYYFGGADEVGTDGAKEARERQDSGSSEEGDIMEDGDNITSEDLEPSSSQQPVKTFYFYQAADGQHIYLHGLNARMLELGYGSLDKCPPTLRARIVEKEFGTMTEELRRRLRHLQHLPITCPFEVAEVKLSPPVIPDFAVDAYRDQLETRQRKRAKRAQEERRRERKINEEEDRRWGRKPSPRIRIGSHVQFPTCGTGSSPPVGEVSKSPSMSSVASSASRSPVNLSLENLSLYNDAAPISESASSKDNGPSFAQMLRTASTSVPSWGPRPGGSSPPKYTSVTGSSAPLRPLRPRRNSDSDVEPEAEASAHAPSYNQSFMESISRAMAEHSAVTASAEADHQPKGKKKKNKCKVLFVTARACSGK